MYLTTKFNLIKIKLHKNYYSIFLIHKGNLRLIEIFYIN